MSDIYLDNNATTRPDPAVVDAMLACLRTTWANPSSAHAPGQAAKRLLQTARQAVAALCQAQPAEVVFTSGATESNHWALLGALQRTPERRHLIITALEHTSSLALCADLARRGYAVDVVPATSQGGIDPAAVRARLRADTALVSAMHANNETGVLLPIAEIAAALRDTDIPLHVDATQSAGKVPLDFRQSGAASMALSAHKFHGPKGVGALLLRKGLALPALLPGSQERCRRGGTENLPGIVGMGVAARLAHEHLAAHPESTRPLRDALEQALRARLPQVHIYGAALPRLPNTICLRLGRLEAEPLLTRLERAGIIASAGSACSAGGSEPSPVLSAMGVAPDEAHCAFRLSLSRHTTADDIHRVIDVLCAFAEPSRAAA